jgi:hypothetical protein
VFGKKLGFVLSKHPSESSFELLQARIAPVNLHLPHYAAIAINLAVLNDSGLPKDEIR